MTHLNDYRYLNPQQSIREIAYELYSSVKSLPILSPHGHTDPSWFSENKAFTDPASLLITPDHYVFRLLYSQGIDLEQLGIGGGQVESRDIWRLFAANYYLYAGTPTGVWFDHVFLDVFGIDEKLTADSADAFYYHIMACLQQAEYLPRAILERFNIEVIATTDDAVDKLQHHRAIAESDWPGRVIPTFRPDSLTNLLHPHWAEKIQHLGELTGRDIHDFKSFLQALRERRSVFMELGCTASDHGVESPYTEELGTVEIETLFQKGLRSEAGVDDARQFTGHMLMELAAMSIDDGMVMQLHPGSYRNHNRALFERFGADKGADIPVQTEYTRNLKALLDKYGNSKDLTLILFTLDESTYSRELAPLAGHYPALRLGPPWWFHDSIEGMLRYRQATSETATIWNTVGFNDDTRALLSIPARHDLSRRMDANFLAGMVADQRIDISDAKGMARGMAYDLAKEAYKL